MTSPTIVSLARGCLRLGEHDERRIRESLRHLALDWVVDRGWQVEQWGLRHPGPHSALAGRYRVRGPRLAGRLPAPLAFLAAWACHALLVVWAPRHRVVVAQTPLMGVGVALMRRVGLCRPAFVVRVVGRTATVAWHVDHAPVRGRVIDALERFVLRRADLVLPVGIFTSRIALSAGVDESRIIAFSSIHGTPAARHQPQARQGTRVLCGARLSEEKGLDTLLEAWAMVASSRDVTLDIAGDGPERAHLEQLADQLQICDRVRFLGWIPAEQMQDLLTDTAIGVLPSRCEEGLPRFLVEAGASGCALVASALGGSAEIVVAGQSGFLVPPDDPPALASALGTVLGDDELRGRLGEGARRRALAIYAARDTGFAAWQEYCESRVRA